LWETRRQVRAGSSRTRPALRLTAAVDTVPGLAASSPWLAARASSSTPGQERGRQDTTGEFVAPVSRPATERCPTLQLRPIPAVRAGPRRSGDRRYPRLRNSPVVSGTPALSGGGAATVLPRIHRFRVLRPATSPCSPRLRCV